MNIAVARQSCTGLQQAVTLKEEHEGRGTLIAPGFAPVPYQQDLDTLVIAELPAHFPALAFLPLLASIFCRKPRQSSVHLQLPTVEGYALSAIRQGLFDSVADTSATRQTLTCHRETFWQTPHLWLTAPSSMNTPLRYTITGEKRHPVRAPTAPGEVYRRHFPRLGSTFSLRTIEIEQDLIHFNRWMNLEQVAFFWEQAGSLEEHTAYLQQQLLDPRVHPLIGCFDDEPFAYFEVYWCKEDRIAPFYDVQDYDRGWHVVIGESKHQGVGKLKAWFQSLMHYMFVDDPRTQRIMGEPRIDHTRQIDFLKSQGYGHLKNIQLPHKQAALLRLERETFFGEQRL